MLLLMVVLRKARANESSNFSDAITLVCDAVGLVTRDLERELDICCGATEGSEQQHNQDLKEIFKGRRILEFITFYHNALHLTRVHCATNNSKKNTGKFGG